MGLDTFASNTSDAVRLTQAQEQAFEDARIQLCGGMFSGGGGSFRGKIYSALISQITGVSLYEAWIPPEEVRAMYRKLAAVDPQTAEAQYDVWNLHPDEILELQKFFRVCAEQDLGLIGWW
jgi:hypothetical protein